MRRHAVLLVNSVDYNDQKKSLPASVLSQITKDMATRLRGLADLSFQVDHVIDQTLGRATKNIDRVLKIAGKEDALLLFYYFGHAVTAESDLLFFFKDSKIEMNTSMMKFLDLAAKIEDFKISKTVFILDCCYAGAASFRTAKMANHDYFLMASATPIQKSMIDYQQRYPIGHFTKALIELIGSSSACRSLRSYVTFRDIFKGAKSKVTQLAIGQDPQSLDSGLGDEVFFNANRRPELRRGLNAKFTTSLFIGSFTKYLLIS